ncbi:hypothetical protein Patl1_05426 [Pistacia atlantica]|uniref:Uncharacterized protein n=1 Tax=Pistacia atlantica TaxID=434234 RepID=A0ACC1BT13_9ROSI|nr:hypothetical protein Patl1_05426 [Pistacia atlantica]
MNKVRRRRKPEAHRRKTDTEVRRCPKTEGRGLTSSKIAREGKLKLEDNVANIWPEFGSNEKDLIKLHYVLNHTSGLHHALVEVGEENPVEYVDWDDCLRRIEALKPNKSSVRSTAVYHYLFWLYPILMISFDNTTCIRKKFKEILEEVFIRPLNIEGELYVGIPAVLQTSLFLIFSLYRIESNSCHQWHYHAASMAILRVESRLATLTMDEYDLKKYADKSYHSPTPEFQRQSCEIITIITNLPVSSNILYVRVLSYSASNLHCSAHALARYYAALADGGVIHPHIPLYPSHHLVVTLTSPHFLHKRSQKNQKVRKTRRYLVLQRTKQIIKGKDASGDDNTRPINIGGKIFSNPKIHDAFGGVGDYEHLALLDGPFGLWFKRNKADNGSIIDTQAWVDQQVSAT